MVVTIVGIQIVYHAPILVVQVTLFLSEPILTWLFLIFETRLTRFIALSFACRLKQIKTLGE